jgi:hypothetical protein
MKFTAIKNKLQIFPLLVSILIFAPSHCFANSLITGGWVPERRSLIITPNQSATVSVPGEETEVAIIEIENNLPEYELVLDFSDTEGGVGGVSEVRLEGVDGILGRGLRSPAESMLEPGALPGRFLWRPGRQETATVGYRVRVMVICKDTRERPPQLLVAMPFVY